MSSNLFSGRSITIIKKWVQISSPICKPSLKSYLQNRSILLWNKIYIHIFEDIVPSILALPKIERKKKKWGDEEEAEEEEAYKSRASWHPRPFRLSRCQMEKNGKRNVFCFFVLFCFLNITEKTKQNKKPNAKWQQAARTTYQCIIS